MAQRRPASPSSGSSQEGLRATAPDSQRCHQLLLQATRTPAVVTACKGQRAVHLCLAAAEAPRGSGGHVGARGCAGHGTEQVRAQHTSLKHRLLSTQKEKEFPFNGMGRSYLQTHRK